MTRAMRRVILSIVFVTLVTSLTVPSSQAQSTPRLAALGIDVWLEYDRASTALIIYRGEFAPGTPVPELVKIRIPASAGEPAALASPEPGKETAPVNLWTDLIVAKKASTSRSGDWIEVTFSPLSRLFTLEFYDKVNTATPDRRYMLTWPGDLAADSVQLNVREPYGATNFQATPNLPPGVRDDEGLMAHQLTLGGVNVGQALAITLAYRREDKRTSAEALQLTTPVPTRQPVALPTSNNTSAWLLIAALAVGLALIVGGVVWYLRSQSTQRFRPYEPPKYARHKGRRSVRTGNTSRVRPRPVAMRLEQDEPEEKAFCTQCGKPLTPEDTFCSRCGARVKGK